MQDLIQTNQNFYTQELKELTAENIGLDQAETTIESKFSFCIIKKNVVLEFRNFLLNWKSLNTTKLAIPLKMFKYIIKKTQFKNNTLISFYKPI